VCSGGGGGGGQECIRAKVNIVSGVVVGGATQGGAFHFIFCEHTFLSHTSIHGQKWHNRLLFLLLFCGLSSSSGFIYCFLTH